MQANSTPDPSLGDLFPNHDLTGSLKDHFDTFATIERLIAYVKLIPNYQKLKLNIALTLQLVNIIKEEISSPSIDQFDILIQVLTQLFNINQQEIQYVKDQLMHFNDVKLIKGIPISKKILKSSTRWLFRKLG
jgi:hypothetical protein